ncbi:hypothetical protein [Chitinophaga niabensis]|uniref:hypothetical protein n=1 Tax=Chitinophaga niabensis TaxID=536979 RepID=UPI0011612225|nr:hypothetical protein [Chitinophaga niabensis]
MKTLYRFCLLLITLSLGSVNTYSQGRSLPSEYYSHIRSADSLLNKGAYTQASEHYRKAFLSFGWSGTPDDRYNSARAFALAGNRDSTIATLQTFCIKARAWDPRKLNTDTAFSFIRTSPAFAAVIDCMKANKEKYAPNFNYEW